MPNNADSRWRFPKIVTIATYFIVYIPPMSLGRAQHHQDIAFSKAIASDKRLVDCKQPQFFPQLVTTNSPTA